MPTKRNYLIKVMDAKIVDVKRALEAKGIKIESIYEMYKEAKEPETVATPPPGGPSEKAPAPQKSGTDEGQDAARPPKSTPPTQSDVPSSSPESGSEPSGSNPAPSASSRA
jgi:hypothetical protein